MSNIQIAAMSMVFLFLAACGESATDSTSTGSAATEEFSISDSGIKTKNIDGFEGVIAESYSDSQD